MMQVGKYTVGQLARASQTKTVTIRYYEQRGLLRDPPRTPGGYRVYDTSDLQRLLFIRRARNLGFSLRSVNELLDLADLNDAPCADVNAKLSQHLIDVRERLDQLQALEEELHGLSQRCQGDGKISSCQIIEALSVDRDRDAARAS
ncbi:MAG: helix-turn-helix domain-containing protein [Pseudomonadota bacterium]